MKVYLLNLDYYYEDIEHNEHYTEVYSSLEKAVEDGKYFISKRCNDDGFRDYEFDVIETDPVYAEQFDAKKLNIDVLHKENLGIYEPTHIVYVYRKSGELLYKHLEYRDKQRKYINGFTVFPEDEVEDAGEKFKIGDIVRVKPRDIDDYYSNAYMDYWSKDKLYIVRWLPRRKVRQKYFENTYALISIYNEDEYIKGLFTAEHYEKDIELFDGKLDENSPICFLQKIIKNEIAVTKETWADLKNGKVLLDETGTFRNLKEYKDGDTWNWFSNTISRQDTGLAGDLFVSFGCFYEPIKDYLPKLRVHASSNYEDDFYLSLEEQPRIVIGRNTSLTEEDLQNIYNYIREHLDILLEHWDSEGQMDGRDLYINLGLYDKE